MKPGDKIDLVLAPVCGEHAKEHAEHAIPMRKVKEGQPVSEHAVLIKTMPPCPAHPGIVHAEVVYAPDDAPESESTRSGPARVSNPRYRNGWDQVFGDKKRLN